MDEENCLPDKAENVTPDIDEWAIFRTFYELQVI